MNLYEVFEGVVCFASNVPFDFGADVDQVRIQEFLNKILPLQEWGGCKIYAPSAALAEICGLQLLVVMDCF